MTNIAFSELELSQRWVTGATRNAATRSPKFRTAQRSESEHNRRPTTWLRRREPRRCVAKRIVNGQGGGIGIQLGDVGADLSLCGLDLDSCSRPTASVSNPWATAILSDHRILYRNQPPLETDLSVFFKYRTSTQTC